jgi:hypothetical protein
VSRKSKLTKEFVNSVRPPTSGEVWFHDTEIRGFGLRAWAGKKGGGANFCLRTEDFYGRRVRLHFDHYAHARPRTDRRSKLTLGDWLEDARFWASRQGPDYWNEQVAKARQLVQLQSRRTAREAEVFGDVLAGYLTRGPGAGFSQAYRDMIDKSIHRFIPHDMLQSPIGSVERDDFIAAINAPGRSPSVVQALRAFVSKVVRSDFAGGAGRQLASQRGPMSTWY